MENSDAEQIAAFQQRFAQAQATEVIDLSWGFALLQRDFPSSHDHNRIVVTSAAPSADILATVDKVMAGAGLAHRYISVVDDTLGQDLSQDFLAAGYQPEAITTMIYQGDPVGPPVHKVQAVTLESMRSALVRDWKILLPDSTDEVFAQLADRTHLYARGADVTRLVVFEGTEVAARVDLYVDHASGIAQVENLFTHPDYRGRGYGKSLVCEAQRRGQDAGCRLTFLGADLDDWPRQWYLRLGYIEADRSYNFTRVA